MDNKHSLFNFEYTMNGFSKLKIAQISIICHCGIVRKYVRSDLTDTCFSFDVGGSGTNKNLKSKSPAHYYYSYYQV